MSLENLLAQGKSGDFPPELMQLFKFEQNYFNERLFV